MCSGCTPCGNSTRFGSGKRRATPLNEPRSEGSGLMGVPPVRGSVLVTQKRRRVGPRGGRRVEADDGNQRLLRAQVARRWFAAEQAGEAALHVLPERRGVQAEVDA